MTKEDRRLYLYHALELNKKENEGRANYESGYTVTKCRRRTRFKVDN